MRLRSFLVPVWSPSVHTVILVLALVMAASPGWAASAVVKDGNTLQLGDITYRLDGIDAPELDQICIDDHADPWTCGVDARDQLAKLIGQRPVRCSDQGPDKNHRRRHSGICTVEGETTSLNQLLVRQGFALNFEPAAKGRFRDDEAGAKNDRRGLWKGCFVSPEEFRHGKKDGILLGGRAGPTRIVKSAKSCSRPTPQCHPAAASRANSRCGRGSRAISASIICRGAAVIRRSPGRIAGSAPRTRRRRPAFAGPIIAGRAPQKNEGARASSLRAG